MIASLVADDVPLIVGGYLLVLGAFAAYSLRLLARGRRLASQLPDKDKPWVG